MAFAGDPQEGEFSTKSDVWSFGVLLWEIFTRCKTDPFDGLKQDEVKAKAGFPSFVNPQVWSGTQPLFVPDESPSCVKKTLALCLEQSPDKRPGFAQIYDELSKE